LAAPAFADLDAARADLAGNLDPALLAPDGLFDALYERVEAKLTSAIAAALA